MATQNSKVTAGEVVSATRKYTNHDDATRKFNISADVNLQNKKVTSLNSGVVTKKDSPDHGNGNFGAGENLNYFSFSSNGFSAEEIKEAINSVLTFISDVASSVESVKTEE